MSDETSNEWIGRGAVVLRTGWQLVQFLGGLWVAFLGVCGVVLCAYGLALPDADLVKSYVELIAGWKAGAAALPVGHGQAVPVLASVVIGVRLVLVRWEF